MGKKMGIILDVSLSRAFFSPFLSGGLKVPRSDIEVTFVWIADLFPHLQDLSSTPGVRNFSARNVSALTFLDFGSWANLFLGQ